MAYDSSYTIDARFAGGRRTFRIVITETEAAAASEYTINQLPKRCTLVKCVSSLTAGTGTTVQPRFGGSSGWTSGDVDEQGAADTAAETVHINTPIRLDLTSGTLYGRSSVDAGSDNDVTTVLSIVDGWH